jgi:hypothetical protein
VSVLRGKLDRWHTACHQHSTTAATPYTNMLCCPVRVFAVDHDVRYPAMVFASSGERSHVLFPNGEVLDKLPWELETREEDVKSEVCARESVHFELFVNAFCALVSSHGR